MTSKKNDTFTGIEYVQLNERRRTLITLPGERVNGLGKTELSNLLAAELQREGVFAFTFKYIDDPQIKIHRFRIFFSEAKKKSLAEDPGPLRGPLRGPDYAGQVGPDNLEEMKKILDLKGQLLQSQIDFYKEQADFEKTRANRLSDQLKTQTPKQDEGDQLQQILLMQLLGKFMKPTTPAHSAPTLRDSSSALPQNILDTIGEIDFAQLPPEEIETLGKQLQQIINLKGLPKRKESA